MTISFKDKVAIVTGAGGGLGKQHALEFARRGAKVVVNDLGGAVDGSGGASDAANAVVEEIKAEGGEAISNGSSVADKEGGSKMVAETMDTWGRIDVLVNNAGILRDTIFHKMDPSDWESVINVHLNGSFYVSRAVAPYFREQNSGVFVHMTSTSGLIGNFGQANYSAAKLGIVGLSKSIALDMSRFKVRSNCIAPCLLYTSPSPRDRG